LVRIWAFGSIIIFSTLALFLIPYTPQAEAGVFETICSGDLLSGLYNNVQVETGETCSVRPGAVIQGDLVGGEDSTIALVGATVDGDVTVGTNGRLVAYSSLIGGDLLVGDGSRVWLGGNNTIGGGIQAENCFSMGMYNLNPIFADVIFGDVHADGCNHIRVRNSSIGGLVDIRNTLFSTTLAGSFVNDNVVIEDNLGTVYRAAQNTVGGDMTVDNNDTSTSVLSIPGFISGNFIAGDLECSGNNPAPVAGVTSGLNGVTGDKFGQCAGL